MKPRKNEKFGPNGCLRFPEILAGFDIDHEIDPEVTAHLRSCPRCWKLFDSVVRADTELVAETFADIAPVGERGAEMEALIYDELFKGARDAGRTARIEEIINDSDKNELVYMLHFLDFLCDASAAAQLRSGLLRVIISEALANAVNEGEIEIEGTEGASKKSNATGAAITAVISFINKKYAFPAYAKRIAAGAGDGDVATGVETLSNGTKFEITYKGGGEDTEVVLLSAVGKAPVLLSYPVKDDWMIDYAAPARELRSVRRNGRPVYKLSGLQRAALAVPGEAEPLPIYTIDDVRAVY